MRLHLTEPQFLWQKTIVPTLQRQCEYSLDFLLHSWSFSSQHMPITSVQLLRNHPQLLSFSRPSPHTQYNMLANLVDFTFKIYPASLTSCDLHHYPTDPSHHPAHTWVTENFILASLLKHLLLRCGLFSIQKPEQSLKICQIMSHLFPKPSNDFSR